MSGMAGMLGLGGGAAGTGFQGPQQANIQTPVTGAQATNAYGQNQNALQQQQQLLQALQGQNGIGNQSQVYGQLQGIASGAVNPAQAQFNLNTAQNVAQQSALQAGQRGAAGNVGLMARQAGQMGAGIQQQAAGQAAAQQAQNQISAIGAAGNLANTMAGQQIGQTQSNTAAQQAEQSNLLNAIGQQNQAQVGSQSSVNAANAGLAQQQLVGQQNVVGGVMNAAGTAAKLMADGGSVMPQQQAGPQSFFGKFLSGVSAPSSSYAQSPILPPKESGQLAKQAPQKQKAAPLDTTNTQTLPASTAMDLPAVSRGGMVDVRVSPGEKIVPPQEVKKVAMGGKPQMKTVPGKAEVKGDSLKNDKVPAKLPEGTVVVKRTRANNDPEGFIRSVLAKRGKK